MALILVPIDEPCDDCPETEGVLVLVPEHSVRGDVITDEGIALCAACRIRAEALLRGSRKQGTRVANWEVAE